MAEDTKFKPGQSGNPDGRPKGSKDKRTALRELLQPHAEELVTKVVELAKGGDTIALRLCLERLIPAYRASDCLITLVDIEGTLTEKGEKIISAMGNGEVTPSDASTERESTFNKVSLLMKRDLDQRLRRFATRILGLANELYKPPGARRMADQIAGSGPSIRLNYAESQAA